MSSLFWSTIWRLCADKIIFTKNSSGYNCLDLFFREISVDVLIAGLKAPYTENPTETTQPLTILLLCGILAPFKIGKTIRS